MTRHHMHTRRVGRRSAVVHTLALVALIALVSIVGASVDVRTVGGAPLQDLRATGPYAQADRLTPPRVTQSVVVVGDSLMVGVVDDRYVTGPSLLQLLAFDGTDAVADARVGQTIPQAVLALTGVAAQIAAADTVVVGLGTNDIHNSGGLAVTSWRASIETMIGSIRSINPTARIVWVDVSFERFAVRSIAFNAQLRETEQQGRIEVCPWRSFITAHPELLANDGLHLRSGGYAARRNLIYSCIVAR